MKISPDDKKKLQTLLQQYEAECEIERIREQQRKEAEEKARQEAEEKARQEAEEKARQEAEEKARKEAEAMGGFLTLAGIIACIYYFGFANILTFVIVVAIIVALIKTLGFWVFIALLFIIASCSK